MIVLAMMMMNTNTSRTGPHAHDEVTTRVPHNRREKGENRGDLRVRRAWNGRNAEREITRYMGRLCFVRSLRGGRGASERPGRGLRVGGGWGASKWVLVRT